MLNHTASGAQFYIPAVALASPSRKPLCKSQLRPAFTDVLNPQDIAHLPSLLHPPIAPLAVHSTYTHSLIQLHTRTTLNTYLINNPPTTSRCVSSRWSLPALLSSQLLSPSRSTSTPLAVFRPARPTLSPTPLPTTPLPLSSSARASPPTSALLAL